jgi:hypothetical protein
MIFRFSRHRLRATLCALFGLFAFSSAQSETVVCDNCDQATMQTEAISQGIGTHYIVDVVNNIVRKFDVSGKCRVDRETGGTECWGTNAIERTVEQPVRDYVGEIHTLSKNTILIDSDNMRSGYDTLTNTALRTAVGTIVGNSAQGQRAEFVFSLRNILAPLGFNAVPPTMTTIFFDGVTAVFVFNPERGAWELQRGSVRDFQGNPVVIVFSDFGIEGGIFDFNGGSLSEAGAAQAGRDLVHFLEAARRFGVPIVGAPSSRLRLVCIKVSNGPWECRYT